MPNYTHAQYLAEIHATYPYIPDWYADSAAHFSVTIQAMLPYRTEMGIALALFLLSGLAYNLWEEWRERHES